MKDHINSPAPIVLCANQYANCLTALPSCYLKLIATFNCKIFSGITENHLTALSV